MRLKRLKMKNDLGVAVYLEAFSKRGLTINQQEIVHHVADTPVMKQVLVLLDCIDTKGLKLTDKGNLPSKVVKEIVLTEPDLHTQFTMKISKRFIEDEQIAAQRIRNLCEVAKLVRVKQGKLVRGKRYDTFMSSSISDQYIYLFFSYDIVNLAYFDGHQEEDITAIMQYHFLQIIRDAEMMYRGTEVYLEFFYGMSNWVKEEIPQKIEKRTYGGGDVFDTFSNIVEIRLMKNFFVLFGLVSEKNLGEGLIKEYQVIKTPLLDHFLQGVENIQSDKLLTPKLMRAYIKEATKYAISLDNLQIDVSFCFVKCIDSSIENQNEILEILLSKYKVIGTKAKKLEIFFRDIIVSVSESVKYFTRLEAKGGKEGDIDRFKVLINALYLLLPTDKPRNVFSALNHNSYLLMEYMTMLFGIDSKESDVVESRFRELFDDEVIEDLNHYFYALIALDKKSKKMKRMTKEYEGLSKEVLVLMMLAIMSVRTFIEDA